MNRQLLIAVAAFMLAAPCAALGQSAPPTPVPDYKPDFTPMAMFLGTWSCKSLKTPDGRTVGHTFTTNTVMAFDGRWMETDQASKPFDKYRTRVFSLKTWLTFDPDTMMWVGITVDSIAGYGVTMSPGWTGDTLVTNDKLLSNGTPLGVDTVTKLSDTHFHDHYEVVTPKGTQISESDCTKAP